MQNKEENKEENKEDKIKEKLKDMIYLYNTINIQNEHIFMHMCRMKNLLLNISSCEYKKESYFNMISTDFNRYIFDYENHEHINSDLDSDSDNENNNNMNIEETFSEYTDEKEISVKLLISALDEKLNEIKIDDFDDMINENFLFNDKYIILEKIKSGSFGVVYKIKNISDDEICALKKLDMGNNNIKSVNDIYKEINFTKNLRCKYIVKFIDAYYNPETKNFYIISKYVPNGPIINYDDVLCCKKYNKKNIVLYIEKITKGLLYLKKNNVIHGDIKPDNILLDENDNPIIIDFGFSNFHDFSLFEKSHQIGNMYFSSPEILGGNKMTFGSDVWAFGCIIYSMIKGVHPFFSKNKYEVIKNICEYKYDDANLEDDEKDLFKKIFCKENERVSIENLLYLSYFKDNLSESPEYILDSLDKAMNGADKKMGNSTRRSSIGQERERRPSIGSDRRTSSSSDRKTSSASEGILSKINSELTNQSCDKHKLLFVEDSILNNSLNASEFMQVLTPRVLEDDGLFAESSKFKEKYEIIKKKRSVTF